MTPIRRPHPAALLSTIVMSMALVAGCDRQSPAADAPRPEATQEPIRVAALLPFAADQLIELGVTPVAVPQLRGDVPSTWSDIPAVTIDHSAGPNLEQLMAADPDVIISSSVYAQFLPSIESSTGAEIVLMDVDTVADVAVHIERLGEITDRADQADALLASLNRHMAPVETEADPIRVLAVFGTPHAFYAFLPGSYLGDLVAQSGGVLITDDMQSHGVFRGLAPISMEAVIDRDPQHLLVVFHGPEASARAMLERDALWGGLDAVRDGELTFLKDDLYAMRPGSELSRAVEEIREIMNEARSRLQ